jgi:hypothetical protein
MESTPSSREQAEVEQRLLSSPKATPSFIQTIIYLLISEASQTLLQMIEKELRQQGFELWQPDLGTAGILQHI